MIRFYGYFAATYGTLWLVTTLAALLTWRHIELGMIGLIGFPVAALFYAIVRLVATEFKK